MIIKKREPTLAIEKLQALCRRLPMNHPVFPEVENDLDNRLAGMTGEHSIDYPLSLLPPEDYFIFHGLRLFHDPHFFQIDTLIVTRKFLLVTEVKNVAGSLYFDQNAHQLIQTKSDGSQKIFSDPILQVRRQKSLLEGWLVRNGYHHIPVYPLIVLSNPHTSITSTLEPPALFQMVIHRDVLPTKIAQLNENFTEEKLTNKAIKDLTHELLKGHTPLDSAILEKYRIPTTELKKGVPCPHCTFSPLPRIRATWYCPKCSIKHKDAHVQALKDYALLFDTKITNKQARDYLQVTSDTVVKRLLKNMNLPHTGVTKGREYDLMQLKRGRYD